MPPGPTIRAGAFGVYISNVLSSGDSVISEPKERGERQELLDMRMG